MVLVWHLAYFLWPKAATGPRPQLALVWNRDFWDVTVPQTVPMSLSRNLKWEVMVMIMLLMMVMMMTMMLLLNIGRNSHSVKEKQEAPLTAAFASTSVVPCLHNL